jgi:hypothetical protein
VNIPWILSGVFTLLGTTIAALMGLDDRADLNETDRFALRPSDDATLRPGEATWTGTNVRAGGTSSPDPPHARRAVAGPPGPSPTPRGCPEGVEGERPRVG